MYKKCLLLSFFFLLALTAGAQKVGLVLSGGGAKGLYHIGVLKALEQNGIPIDCISGTSMGSIIGGLYAIGMTPEQMEAEFTSEKINYWITGQLEGKYKYYFKQMHHDAAMISLRFGSDANHKFAASLPSSLVSSTQLDMAFIEYFSAATVACGGDFDNLMIPFRCVASDATGRREVVWRSGDLGRAIRTSMTIPMMFRPIQNDTMMLFDGGLFDNFPWKVLKEEFAPDLMIGSKCIESGIDPDNNASMIDQVFSITTLHTDYSLPEGNVMIDRVFNNASMMDFSKAQQLIDAGYQDALSKVGLIRERMAALATPATAIAAPQGAETIPAPPPVQPRRADSLSMEVRRSMFNARCPELIFAHYEIEGLTADQTTYVRKLLGLGKGDRDYTMDEFRSAYFKILAEGKIDGNYPRVQYDPQTRRFGIRVRMNTKPSLRLKIGGNISSTALNQAYVGVEYSNMGKSMHTYNLDGYFSPFYLSAGMSMRSDFFLGAPFYYELGASYNYYNYFRSDYGMVSKMADLTYAKQDDTYAKAVLGMPLGRFSVLNAQGNAGVDNYQYSQSSKPYERGDVLDRTSFDFVGAKLEIERNDVNYLLYPTRGILQKASVIAVTGNEKFTPGSSGDAAGQGSDAVHRYWVGGRFTREHYIPVAKWFTCGYLVDLLYTTHPDFMNANATNMTSPAFTPTAHSKIVYLKEFRTATFAGAGLIPVFEFAPSFYLRTGAYAFLPESYNGVKMDVKSSLRFLFDANLVYQTLVGPVSLSVSKYDTSKNNWFITFNFGLALF
ncbi:MAG: patatin-like phospholipase family protein, partial [Rikenellaceae bacterium]|nr:patatin-like phospholipase family protein [Rikenellaceae bacterium]